MFVSLVMRKLSTGVMYRRGGHKRQANNNKGTTRVMNKKTKKAFNEIPGTCTSISCSRCLQRIVGLIFYENKTFQ